MGADQRQFARFVSEARAAARLAGRIQLDSYGASIEVSRKGDINLVTEVDHRCERAVVDHLHAAFPDHRILAEEGYSRESDSEYRWIVDPLDGTTNYAHGYPRFCVAIALEQSGRVLLGVVLDPVLDEEFVAVLGGGATLNGRPIRVSARTDVLHSLLATGFAYDIRENPDNNLDYFEAFMMEAQAVRRDGSAELNLCYTAMGRFDGFWEMQLSPWDVAAGGLIVREAGGVVTDFEGRPNEIDGRLIVASNGKIQGAMLEIIRRTRARSGRPAD
ncbi:MAG: inositol monophosphatase family protein [Deltaproteobacteria bacterium]|nr:inositol monophosphatase family protein [Deltaproteobacteria bacterium]